ncbi:MAG: hypothetical protein ACOCP4_01180 [Candidatus Woesearchaeota archaeon]
MNENGKLFKWIGDEVSEWCVATSKKEAYEFLKGFWDEGIWMEEYEKKFFKSNPDKTLEDFIYQKFTWRSKQRK